ncbi:MAG: class I SAM-dependent RNA methyltransferase [Clostridiales bacterium]|jgi:putative N6-adenine-specific DNA methylase|nr:class I SAM-dependent RNA methyltransferase [Clostridiales bacterium]
MQLTLCAPCLFGLEGLVRDEIKHLGITDVQAQNGRVLFGGGLEELVRANLWLRMAERVLIQMGSFYADSFELLFEGVKELPWESFIPQNGSFPVKGFSLDSQLSSIPSCQSIIKKAVVERLKQCYGINYFNEDGRRFRIQFALQNNIATLYLDTSGDSLHKRGYRPSAGIAPLRETLAAAMVILSRYKGKGIFADPFCGSGTLPIEAALIAKNRAPGLNRSFDAEKWGCIPEKLWHLAREEAREAEYHNPYQLWGGDIDGDCVALARENAIRAGVGDYIHFEQADARDFISTAEMVTVTNPPYGERLNDINEAEKLYKALSPNVRKNLYLLSSHPEFERVFGCKADKKRKLYNGMILCYLYMYFGDKSK